MQGQSQDVPEALDHDYGKNFQLQMWTSTETVCTSTELPHVMHGSTTGRCSDWLKLTHEVSNSLAIWLRA